MHAEMQHVRMSARLRDRITRAGDSGSVYLGTGALLSSEIVGLVFFVFSIFSSPPCCTRYIISIRMAHLTEGIARWARPDDIKVSYAKRRFIIPLHYIRTNICIG